MPPAICSSLTHYLFIPLWILNGMILFNLLFWNHALAGGITDPAALEKGVSVAPSAAGSDLDEAQQKDTTVPAGESQPMAAVTDLDPVVVTARGMPRTISQTPGGIGMITAEDIDRHPPISLTDITRQIPGVEKTMDSPWGSEINIRGLDRNSVLFLIDGCRVNTATDINARFGLVNPQDIERIEVLKGPISALYGWGAMGGVVNVITRKGGYRKIPETRETIWVRTLSNPEGYSAFGRIIHQGPNAWFLGSAGYRDYNDTQSADRTDIHNSQFRDVYGRFGSGYLWNKQNETQANIQVTEGKNIGIPGTGDATLPTATDVTYPSTKRVMGTVTHTLSPESGVLDKSSMRLFFQEVDRNVRIDNFPATMALTANEPGADHTTLGLNWTNHLTLGAHTPVVGLEVWEWTIDNTERTKYFRNGLVGVDSSVGNVSQTVAGIFAEDNWDISDTLNLNMGGRLDTTRVKSDDLYNWISPPSSAMSMIRVREAETATDTSWQAQIGLTWEIAPNWSATGIAAVSYRPPDLMDLFKYVSLSSGGALYGNPDLDPEQSRFFEAGLHYVNPVVRVSGAAFWNDIDDMITQAQVSSDRYEMVNVEKAKIYGLELSGEWRFAPQWYMCASLAWTRGENKTTGEALATIAPLNTRVTLGWDQAKPHSGNNGWRAQITHEWADAQDRVPQGTEESDSWQTLDVSVGYRFKAFGLDQELTAEVTNLFDEDYHNFLATSRGMVLKEPGIGVSLQYKVEF